MQEQNRTSSNKPSKTEISKFLYDNTQNVSSRKVSLPKDNSSITLVDGKYPNVNMINFGFETATGLWSIRCRFVGSDMFYQMNLNREDVVKWFELLYELSESKTSSFFNREEESW